MQHRRQAQFLKVIGTLTLAVFVGVVGAWFIGSHVGGSRTCASAVVMEANCPNVSGVEAAVFHVQSFARYLANGGVGAVSVSVMVAVLAMLMFADGVAGLAVAGRRPSALAFTTITSSPSDTRTAHWLAFHEHSPSTVFRRA